MQLYITKGVQQIGPFSEEELRKQLDCGEAKYTDLAWHEGRADWVPLSEILPSKPVPISPPPPDHLPSITNAANAKIDKPQQIAKGTVLDSNSAVPPPIPDSAAAIASPRPIIPPPILPINEVATVRSNLHCRPIA